MTRRAAIDVGTNSVRLLIAEIANGDPVEVERDLEITRMGEGVDASRRMSDAALGRTLRAIAAFHRRATDAGAATIRIVATSAIRDSQDRDRFVEAVRRVTGAEPEILSGEQEARLSFMGAAGRLAGPGPYLILDVGGGSTEFVRGAHEVEAWTSLDIGSVRLTERHVRSDPPGADELAAISEEADRAVEEAKRIVGTEPGTLVGLAGTITTMAAVSLELDSYDRSRIHHARLSFGEIRRVADRLASMTDAERRTLPVMPPGREDVIVAGALILVRVMEGFRFGEVVVSEADLLDGLVLSSVPGPASS